jgi:tRNA-2-methylthio-N6-dimethylallyladenosine synthase
MKQVYQETFGCQMNERDSEIMVQLLKRAGYQPTGEIAAADLILINTCSIRDKAEQKVYSYLGRLRNFKKKKPSLIIIVAGCVAQQEGKNLPSRMDLVDIVVGTQNIYELPELIEKVISGQRPQIATGLTDTFRIPSYIPSVPDDQEEEKHPFKKFVTIMQGCDNFCTYCVVPHTRGREVSRPAEDILDEINSLVDNGVVEVTLLGQNVNSYGKKRTPSDTVRMDFPALLRAVAEIDGLQRIRFTTSHPKDLSADLIRCFAEIDKLCAHFHLPVQSGSDRVLQRMNRKYTAADYLARVEQLRQVCPEIAITTDIIVGFPGETDDDFEATMDLLEKVRYHGAFSFKYSDRALAKACNFDDKVEEDVKAARLTRLQARQNEITLERNRDYVGKRLRVMVEGKSRAAHGQLMGRADTNQIVNFDSVSPLLPGQIVEVDIREGLQNSLRGVLVTDLKVDTVPEQTESAACNC